MDYIRFSVDGQRLDYDRKYYSSTDTIDTLYCNFKFETDDLGHILGGWDLPYLWAQFHDEEGNVYIKAVTDNACSIPHNCLKQLKFKMTLFATDTEDYMTCKKRYTTNEIAFKFKGKANINYDGGVSPDEPVPTQWQLLLDRVDECEDEVDELSQDVTAISGRVDGLSQDVTNIGDRVDGLSQDVSTIDGKVDTVSQTVTALGDKVDGIDNRVTSNTTAIEGLSQDVTSIHGDLDDLSTSINAEVTARTDGDTRLEGLIDDETTAREQLDADVRRWFTEESNARVNSDNNLQNNINSLETTVRSNYSSCMSRMDSLDSRITGNTSAISGLNSRVTNNANAIEGINTTVDGLSTDLVDESTARADADTRLEGLVADETAARETADTNLQSLIIAESTARSSEDARLEGLIGDRYTKTEADDLLDAESAAREAADTNLQSLITAESTARTDADTRLEGLIDDERTARENADADLRLLINDEVNERTSSYNALDNRVITNENNINDINTTVELLYKTLKKDNSWDELVELIRSGKAEQFLNYGDQIEENWIDVDNNNKEYSNVWDIAKFEDVETREGTIKGLFLKTHWATLKPIQFSHNRAFYACKDGLSAGTYHITLGADWGTNAKKDKSYQFTLTNNVPVGGKLAGLYSMPDVAPQNWKVYVYAENGIDILENAIAVTEGTGGTSLGTLKLNVRDGNLNSMQETGYGNNDWELSAYRQYLNSREGKGAWWTAQDEWDIAPDQLNTVSGFLCGISDELYNSMQTVKVKTWKNNPTHGGVESYTYDKVFLPSKEELYYTPQKAGEGTYYPLMKEQLGLDSPLADYTNYAPNITYAIENHSSAQYVRLRSAYLISACDVWAVNASGFVYSYYVATYAYRCTPVCVIG